MIVVLLAVIGIALAVWRRGAIRGTTLTSSCNWLILSLAALAVVELVTAAEAASEILERPLRFAAATTTFCPLMALLGAKRPQDRSWFFVVVTFWIVLALPAGETLLLRPGQALDIQGLRAVFLVLLVLLGLANSSLTRFWPAAWLFAAAQTLLIAEFLPFGPVIDRILGKLVTPLALGLIVMSLASIWLLEAQRARSRSLDRVWLDFRDMFGLFWGLRVAERVNAAAHLNDWPVRLRWSGFTGDGSDAIEQLPTEVTRALRQNLENLLRRFVSQAWITDRLGEQD